jgi:hypothetical protein
MLTSEGLRVYVNSDYELIIIAKRVGEFQDIHEKVDINIIGAGGLDEGKLESRTWYRVYLISKGKEVKGIISKSYTNAPNLPNGYGLVSSIWNIFINEQYKIHYKENKPCKWVDIRDS